MQQPGSLASDSGGNVYVAYGTSRQAIARVSPFGVVTPVVGRPDAPLARAGDGAPAVDATTCGVTDLVVTSTGRLWFTEADSQSLRVVNADGTIHTRISPSNGPFWELDCPPKGDDALRDPRGVTLAPDERVVAAASGGYELIFYRESSGITRWSTTSYVSPEWLAHRGDGTYFMSSHNSVFRVQGNGAVGDVFNFRGHFGSSGDGGPAMEAKGHEVTGLTSLPDDRVLVIDPVVGRVRDIGGDRIIRNLVGGGGGAMGSDQQAVRLQEPIDAEPIAAGLVVSERGANRLSIVDKTTVIGAPPPVTSQDSWTFTLSSWYSGPWFSCQTDNAVWRSCGLTEGVGPLTDGDHVFRARATDLEGTDPTPAEIRWQQDTQAPHSFALSEPNDGATVQGRPILRWESASDATSGVRTYAVLLDGTDVAHVLAGSCAPSCAWQPVNSVPEGPHRWQIRAIDGAGLTRDTATSQFTVDTAPPTGLETVAPVDGAAVSGSDVELRWTSAQDASPVRYEVIVDGGSPTMLTGTQTQVATLQDGPHRWQVIARDAADNATTSPERQFTVDTRAPHTTLTGGPAAWTRERSASFVAANDESKGHLECSLDGSAPAICPAAIALDGLSEGSHWLEVTAVDRAGNRDQTPSTHTWSVDVTPPSAPVDIIPADGASGISPRTQLSFPPASDVPSGIASYRVELDGAPLGQLTAAQCAAPAERCHVSPLGELAGLGHTWRVVAIDMAGNERASAAAFRVDAAPPTGLRALSPPDGARIADASPLLQWAAASDADSGVAGYEVSVDGGPAEQITGLQRQAQFSEGEHRWSVAAVDRADNHTHAVTSTLKIDRTPPVALLRPVPRVVAGRDVTLDASGSTDPDSGSIVLYEFDLDGDGVYERSGTEPTVAWRVPVAGTYPVRVRVTDEVGLAATADAVAEVEPLGGVVVTPVTVSINGGAFATKTLAVTLDIRPPVRSGARLMAISNDGGLPDDAPRIAIADTRIKRDWRLATGDGSKTPRHVSVFFFNASGRQIGRADDEVIFDPIPPVILQAKVVGRTRTRVRVRVRVRDRFSGVARVEVRAGRRRVRSPAGRRMTSTKSISIHARRGQRITITAVDVAGNRARRVL